MSIIITTIFYLEIQDFLLEHGFKCCFLYSLKAYTKIDWALLCHLHEVGDAKFYHNIDKLLAIVADKKSQDVISQIVKNREQKILDYRLIKSYNKEYVDPEILLFDDNEVVIDGGAYIGDTVEVFVQHLKHWKQIMCFEPDYTNFKQLQKVVGQYANVKAYPHALGKTSGSCYYNSGHGAGSGISKSITPYRVVTDSIDSLESYPITYLKLDLEGNELQALQGAKQVIQQYKPKLAICVYHKADDLWEIPLFVKSLRPDYKIYIRHYGDNWTDTIMYAV